jgi:hypothetical protein
MRGSSYVLAGWDGGFWTRKVESLPSQYLRRWLSEQLGRSDWDWRTAENADLNQRAKRLRDSHTQLVR